MNCLYCNTNLNNDVYTHTWNNGIFVCYVCSITPLTITFFFDDWNSEITFIHMRANNYLIEIVRDAECCNIFDFNVKACKLITLDYIPDVTPKTAVAWLNKLLNLKAFF